MSLVAYFHKPQKQFYEVIIRQGQIDSQFLSSEILKNHMQAGGHFSYFIT